MALLLPVAVVLWVVSGMLAPGDPDILTIRVTSQVTGEGIEGANVTVGDIRYKTDLDGTVRIDPVESDTPIAASAVGYESVRRDAGESRRGELALSLNGILVIGSIKDAVSGEPVVGANVSAVDVEGDEFATNTTDNVGGFVFKLVPEDTRLLVDHDIYGTSEHLIRDRRTVSILLDPPAVVGRVMDNSGEPVAGAIIIGPAIKTTSDEDGWFELHMVGQGSELKIESGEGEATTIVVEGTDLGDIVLNPTPATPPPHGGSGT